MKNLSSHLSQARMEVQAQRLISPEIRSDHRVMFRVSAPDAKCVTLKGQFVNEEIPLMPGNRGIWNVEVEPIAPGIYEYNFDVDSIALFDPSNGEIKAVRHPRTSILTIPGDTPFLHDLQDVPHGTVHRHSYHSNEIGTCRPVEVYTPFGYETSGRTYPTLYLLPGSGDTQSTWVSHGRLNWMLDNLLAAGGIRPMVVVMLDGEARSQRTPRTKGNANTEALRREICKQVLPMIEDTYRIEKKANSRGIFGVSRGGGQSLMIGLRDPETFAWIGGMSSAIIEHKSIVARALSKPAHINRHVKLLWMCCGKDEGFLYAMNLKFHQALTHLGIRHEFKEVDGSHGWTLWRRHFADFASLLFL